jgi:hypothetical protein
MPSGITSRHDVSPIAWTIADQMAFKIPDKGSDPSRQSKPKPRARTPVVEKSTVLVIAATQAAW